MLVLLGAATLVACKAGDEATPSRSAPSGERAPSAERAAAASSSPALGAVAATTAAAAPRRLPERRGVHALKRACKCTANSPAGPCEVLAAFAECAPWDPVTQSGDGRFMGEGYQVKKGAFVEEISLMRTRRAPTTELAAGELPARLAFDRVADDRAGEREHAKKAIAAFERGDVPKPNNTAIRYVKERTDWREAPALAAEHGEIFVAAKGGLHVCAQKGQRLAVIERASQREHEGDGVYAILHPVSW